MSNNNRMGFVHKNCIFAHIVDDESLILETVEAFLKKHFSVFTAPNGREALSKILIHKIDLILLDINMPEMDGIEVLQRIKRYNGGIPVIMATAREESKAKEAVKLGAVGYILKPYDFKSLLELTYRALNKSG